MKCDENFIAQFTLHTFQKSNLALFGISNIIILTKSFV